MKIEIRRLVFNRYMVTSRGNISSLLTCGGNERKSPLKLKPRKSRNGYLYCDIVNGDNKERWLMHRLVCYAFGRNIKNKIVHHKDGNKLNNSLDNLEVTSASENVKHSNHVRRKLKQSRLKAFSRNRNNRLRKIYRHMH